VHPLVRLFDPVVVNTFLKIAGDYQGDTTGLVL
jgi:hypothetical protein